jgi:hypothetical protein
VIVSDGPAKHGVLAVILWLVITKTYKRHGERSFISLGFVLFSLSLSLLPALMSARDSVEKKSPVGSIHNEKPLPPHIHVDNVIENINAKLSNPLSGLSHEQLMDDGAEFARAHGLGDVEEIFRKGALAAQDPLAFEGISHFTEAEKDIFRRELTHRWDQPATLYYLVILCSVAAAVQGVSLAPSCNRGKY